MRGCLVTSVRLCACIVSIVGVKSKLATKHGLYCIYEQLHDMGYGWANFLSIAMQREHCQLNSQNSASVDTVSAWNELACLPSKCM